MDIKTIALIGVGKKGTSLARQLIERGFDITLYDVNATLLRRSVESIKNELRQSAQQHRITAEQMQEALIHIKSKTTLSDVGSCDVIIETVPDNLQIKKDILKHLDNHAKSSSVLCTTTSLFTVSSVASLSKNFHRIIGLHLFFPIESSQVIEVIPTLRTSKEAIEAATSIARQLGKEPILSKDSPGFIIERACQAWFLEALRIVEDDVADHDQIDRLVTMNKLHPEGPFQQMDQQGLDHIFQESVQYFQQRFYDPRFQPSLLLQQMTELGLLGKQSHQGFYSYKEENQ